MLHLARAIVALVMDLNRENGVQESAKLIALDTLPHSEHDSFPHISSYEESLDSSSNEETLRDILSDNEAVLLASCEVNFLALG